MPPWSNRLIENKEARGQSWKGTIGDILLEKCFQDGVVSESFWNSTPKPALQAGLSGTLCTPSAQKATAFPTVLLPSLSVSPLPAFLVSSSDTCLKMCHALIQKLPLLCSTPRISCFHSTLHELFLHHLSSWTTIAHLAPRRPRREKKRSTILSFSTLLEDSAGHSAADSVPTQSSRQLLLISSLDLTLTLKPSDTPSFLKGTNHSHLHNGRPKKWLHRKLTQ